VLFFQVLLDGLSTLTPIACCCRMYLDMWKVKTHCFHACLVDEEHWAWRKSSTTYASQSLMN